jgi:hypothetical protein
MHKLALNTHKNKLQAKDAVIMQKYKQQMHTQVIYLHYVKNKSTINYNWANIATRHHSTTCHPYMTLHVTDRCASNDGVIFE